MADASKGFTAGVECAVEIGSTAVVARSETLAMKPSWYEPEDGLIGSREPLTDRRRVIKKDVGGGIVCLPTYTEAIAILGCIFPDSGTATDATGFSGYTSKALPASPQTNIYQIQVDRRHATGKVFTYGSCWPSSLTIRYAEAAPVEIELNVLGQTEGTSTDTIAAAEAALPAIMDDVSVTIDGDEYFSTGGEVTVDLSMEDRFHNSLTRSYAQSKVIMVTGKIDLDMNADTWAQFLKNSQNNQHMAIRLKATDGTKGFGLYMAACCITGATPTIGGPDVSKPSLEFRAYKDAAATPTVCCFVKAS
jgi:hypothetical protein